MKKEKKPVQRIKKVKFDFSKAADAIVDGKFIIEMNQRVVVERVRNDKRQASVCIFKGVSPSGEVTMWDDTVSQFFSFSLKDPPLVKLPGDQLEL